ncbi:hypothetical protein GALL_423130 [mine drainage metagenome]|uniref:DUF721 domain-containing protein n=1 Tax=mine drainage metagenome TaxID=410659 RepID=A0A1J5PWZ9_9ZZZZ
MKRLHALFKDSTELQTLIDHAGDLTTLQATWSGVVPPPLREFTRASGLKHRRITVLADNGAVAAKLKLLAPLLLKNLQIKGVEVTSIRVEVQVQSIPRRPPRPKLHLSQQAAGQLSGLAQSLPESPLRTALERLARKT